MVKALQEKWSKCLVQLSQFTLLEIVTAEGPCNIIGVVFNQRPGRGRDEHRFHT
jgi:hypothetical protein